MGVPLTIIMKIVQCIMTMSIVLFFGAPPCLIAFSPHLLDDFTKRSSHSWHIIERVTDLALQSMVANVHLGDQIDDLLDDWYHVWKMLGKALGAVFSVSTIDVVARYDPVLESSFRTQHVAQCIISTAESSSLSVSCTWNGKKDLLFALIQIHHPLWQKKTMLSTYHCYDSRDDCVLVFRDVLHVCCLEFYTSRLV